MATAVLSTAIPLVLARALDLGEYGTYKQIFLIAQTLSLVLPFGMAQSLYFFVPREERARPYVFNALAFLSLGAGIAVALLWIWGEGFARWLGNSELIRYRGELAIYVVGLIGSFPLEIGLTSRGRTGSAALVYLVSDTARAAVMVVPVLYGYGLAGAMRGLAVFSLLRLVATWAVLLRDSSGPLWNRRALLRQLAYAAPFGFAVLVARISKDYHQYAVSSMFSPEVFALYATGCFQLPFIDLIYTPTTEVLMVRVAELERIGRLDEAAEAFRQASARLSLFFFPCAAFFFAAAPEFIGTFFGEKFLGAVPIFRLAVLSIVFSLLPLDGVLRARNETRFILVAFVTKAIASVPLVWIFLHAFGMRGAMVGYLLGECLGRVLLLARIPAALSTAERRLTMRDAVPWGALWRALCCAVVAAAAALLATRLAGEYLTTVTSGGVRRALPLLMALSCFALTYLTLLWCTSVRDTARPRAATA
jgi:O-antigen/teichoic acid export membrane protein